MRSKVFGFLFTFFILHSTSSRAALKRFEFTSWSGDCFTTAQTNLCPWRDNGRLIGLTLTHGKTRNLYGLGQQFLPSGPTGPDWRGQVRSPGGPFGNDMTGFNGGGNGNTQIPILYALGEGNEGYALFLDHHRRQKWDFTTDPWKVEADGGELKGYLITGVSLPDLRRQYMALVGKPLVPPKKMFGLWLSEYGFRNWGEVDEKLAGLRQSHIPVDGFVLDLFWFGGVKEKSDLSAMGRLDWDREAFPDPEGTIRRLRDEQGLGIMPIEESYVSRGLEEHRVLEQRGFLAHDGKGKASYLTKNPWWGQGGMIDWTNEAGADFMHDWKRDALVRMGVTAHWLDLGEPEMYDASSRYAGGSHAEIHNLFNAKWIESVHRGYQRLSPEKRVFMMSRSGAAGIQKFGAAMWSGDIGSDLANLRSQLNVQSNMSLSGVDYFGSDVGGFHRAALKGDLDEMYTQWLANSALFDVPVRPHTENLCRCKQTSPALIGDVESNRENLRLRYSLVPYLYSLAHVAHREGEPVYPPLFYYFQEDAHARTIGNQKMIGPWLMAVGVARHGQVRAEAYLPEGEWVDYHTFRHHRSRGQLVKGIPLYPEGNFRLPLFAREGAIIPRMRVDERTRNVFGNRDELVVRIFPSATPTSFTLYEDDGESTGYLKGAVRTTKITQVTRGKQIEVRIEGSVGHYQGEKESRPHVVEIVTSSGLKIFDLGERSVREAKVVTTE